MSDPLTALFRVIKPSSPSTPRTVHFLIPLIAAAAVFLTAIAQAAPASSPEKTPSATAGAKEESTPKTYSLMDARERGGFDIGPATGGVSAIFDDELQRNILKFDFSAAPKSHTGAWTKKYPKGLNGKKVDAARLGVRVPNTELLNQVCVKVEIKGKKGTQTIPLSLKSGWTFFREPISWDGIGDLTEVVFVVSPIISSGAAEGLLYFDVEFFKLSAMQKYYTFVKVGLVLAFSLLLALAGALFYALFGRRRARGPIEPQYDEPAPPESLGIFALSSIKRDFLYGIVAVLIAGLAMCIYSMGTVNPLDAGFNLSFLALGLMGAAIAQLLKSGLTGKHLTPVEIFQNVLFSGLLAASVSNFDILRAPASWAEVLMLNKTLAVLAFVAYHISNACSLATRGKHIRPVTGMLIIGAPFALNWLMASEDTAFIQPLFNTITGGILAAKPVVLKILGRLLVVFVFNEIFTNGISLGIQGKTLKSLKAHLVMFGVALGVAVASLIADAGSTQKIASMAVGWRALAVILTTMFSFGGLWGEVYLITGIALDAGKRLAPNAEAIWNHVKIGVKKGMVYSGILMTLLYALYMLLNTSILQEWMATVPIVLGMSAGALLFPLLKTIIETFDGSLPFFSRARYSYRDWTLYARGAVAGFGFAYALTHSFIEQHMSDRIVFGLTVGLLASAGISVLRDAAYEIQKRGRIQTWRLYLIDAFLGAFVGSAAAFYLDALQVPVIIEKFKLYTSAGFAAKEYVTYPLLNKWGRIDLGTFCGGAKLLYTESLAGVINWSIAAWLFAVNKVFLQSIFEKQTAPIRNFFSKEGFAMLVENMIYVLRWGLWMSPIIFTFLRMMPDPTWYNQDGAIRTLFAIYNDTTMSGQAFREWSLNVFVYLLAFDFVRILIWMDHMGLRVATMVNLSFIGLDRLDERIARFIGPAAAQRYIPEGVKRFATWAPLLIPFFIPRGKEWEYAWSTSEAIQNAARAKAGSMFAALAALPLYQQLCLVGLLILACAGISCVLRALRSRSRRRRLHSHWLGNRIYRVYLKENGEIYSEVDHKKIHVYPKEYDITRRSYDTIDPCGRILYLLDSSAQSEPHYWPVTGNFPTEFFPASRCEMGEDSLDIVNTSHGVRTTVSITLPDQDSPAEIWNVTVENLTDAPRQIKIVPYLEWVLNGGLHDRFHTQYARLFPEMEYVSGSNAILAWQKSTKSMGYLAADAAPQGFLTSRMDFIGRAQSIWKPRAFETMDFLPVRDTAAYPTFEPIGSLLVDAAIQPKGSKTIRLMIGYAKNKKSALEMIQKYLKPQPAAAPSPIEAKKKPLLIGHGEILPGTPQPYSEFTDHGNKLLVHTPYTPRPYDHAMSNALHSVMVTNRGLHTSCNGNSQQNRLTPDWPDTVTQEVPSEAIYLFDIDSKEWFSPTYHPLNNPNGKYESEFGVDGTAVFRTTRQSISTELTVFVPPGDPLGVYLLTVKNNADRPRRMRVAPFFEMVLEFQPERSGTLQVRHDKEAGALLYRNPRNTFRTGWAFAFMTTPAQLVETKRGRFYGTGRSVAHPYWVEKGAPDTTQMTDSRQIAGLLTTLEIPAHQERTIAVVLGQADDWRDANRLVQKYRDIGTVRKCLEETKNWWLNFVTTVTVQTSSPQFNDYQNWLKYQALAERIWARRGFYQTSGAYGFRDQLQDTVNLMWVDPTLARRQILLHASQQFPEGDVFHWFFTLTDGRTAFSCRSHASDNPVWLPWAVAEYLRATGDCSILDEKTSYVWSEFPFADLPKNKEGWGYLYHRTTMQESVYKHCMRSIDLILKKRTGKHGLPLIRTGDWNDGLDEIGSRGKGESVWLGFFLYYVLKDMVNIIEKKEGKKRREYYITKLQALGASLERTWREDRYLRAIHDDGTEIGVKDSGIWETDALTAAWAVMADIHFDHALTAFNTALKVLEKKTTILLGWPALREDSKPYLGRSSKYPEGVRENGMYCHGVQWLVRAARILAEKFDAKGDSAKADEYRAIAYRLWLKISPIIHVAGQEIELYGGQPNKQAADMLTTYDQGRMIWHGYTGAAGWMVRQAMEGVVGAMLINNDLVLPADLNKPRGDLQVTCVTRDVGKSPLKACACGKVG